MREVIKEVSTHEIINEETLETIFFSIIRSQTSISYQCQRSYEAFTPQIETIFKEELQVFFAEIGGKQWSNQDIDVDAIAVM
ncbi:hypothetical protein [Terribacillus saccharophilus]|uniref:hypothetical protein n=1 Tax=Terribacillus saccharophilus TaxID=361277 RepID=UPI0020D09039|nr:hypothetical protein [Terribacillus saccharophilus]